MSQATTPKRRRRPRGEGSIYETAGGRWRGAVVHELPDGTKRRHVVSGQTEAIVRDKLAELRRELAETGRPTPRTTVTEYLVGWLELQRDRVRPASYLSMEQHCRTHIVPALGHLRLANVRPSDIDRLLDAIQRSGRSAVTAQHVRVTLVHALGDALRDQIVRRNVAALSRPPRAERHSIVYLTAPEVRQMIEGTREAEHGALYALLASTGLRLGEALALRWQDIDLDAGTLSVSRSMARGLEPGEYRIAAPKTASSRRTIPLTATAAEALRRRRARQNADRLAVGPVWQGGSADLIFTDQLGRALNGPRVTRAWQRDREAAGIRRVRLHDLRHSAATLMLAEGVPLAVISSVLGHSSIAVTSAFYAAVLPELHREAADALDRAINGHQQ